ncbi:MAG: hypothetical protein GAK35_02211 [Herbaspirillum frisingense]|uniref:Internal virion protein n=1 Tax=Herbaspirillum frisingense TaxID=92645 RepID=A0A7V8FWJ3_9BURK|nr:MAG: hypothetical protein GAK35_02211 [Herbaspirillum frisingense]
MGWAALAKAAMDFTGSYLQARTQHSISLAQGIMDDANTYSQNLVNNANADAANLTRQGQNKVAAAEASLGNAQRSISNQNKLNAAGSQLNTQAQNFARLQDQMTRGGLEDSLRASEQMGALHAQQAASGTGGASAAMMHATLALSVARQNTSRDNNQQYTTYDMQQQRMGLIQNTIGSLDEGQTFAPIDYNVNVAPLVQSPLRMDQFAGSAVSQAWVGMLGKDAGSLTQSIGSWSSGSSGSSSVQTSNSINYNDGWSNFSTQNFSSNPGLGSGTYDLGSSGSSGSFFSSESFKGGSSGFSLS